MSEQESFEEKKGRECEVGKRWREQQVSERNRGLLDRHFKLYCTDLFRDILHQFPGCNSTEWEWRGLCAMKSSAVRPAQLEASVSTVAHFLAEKERRDGDL